MSEEQPWIPIESDPEIMTKLIQSLTESGSYLIDVPIIDGAEEMGLFTDHNVVAFIFLYTINEKTENNFVGEMLNGCPKDLFHMKQVNKNACGTVALFHAFLNNKSQSTADSSIMEQFYKKAAPEDYLNRGRIFSEMSKIKELHENYACFGQSNLPNNEELNNVAYHYVAFIPYNGFVYELDGRRPYPIKHLECQSKSFISAGLSSIQELINRDPDNYNFAILAFCNPA